jgi:hypothetical protein
MPLSTEVLKYLRLYWQAAADLSERQRQARAADGSTSLAVRCMAARVYATERVQQIETLLQDEVSNNQSGVM